MMYFMLCTLYQIHDQSEDDMIAFWNTAPYSRLKADRRFRGAKCLYHQGLMMESRTSEMSVYFS